MASQAKCLQVYWAFTLLFSDLPFIWLVADAPRLDEALVVLLGGEVVLVRDVSGDDAADVEELYSIRHVPIRNF